jgi:integrase
LTTRALRPPTEKAVADGSPVQAAAVLQVTKALTAFAAGRGDLAVDVGAPLRAKVLGAVTTSRRTRRVVDAELPALLAGFKTVADPTQTLLRLLLTTGVRTQELLNAPWSEIDLKAAVWTIPPERQKLTLEGMKGAEAWRVPLSPAAVDLFKHLRSLEPKSLWVAASSDTKSGHVTDKVLSHAMRRLQGLDKPSARIAAERAAHRKAEGSTKKYPGTIPGRGPRMALPGGQVNAHDFRRTLRSWLDENKCRLAVAERCLGHKLQGVERVYAVADLFDERREWLDKWAAHLATAEGAK